MMMRSTRLLISSLFVVVIATGCSFDYSYESSGGMSVVEDSVINGENKCKLYARNRSAGEVLKLVKPKLGDALVIDPSVDLDRNIDEIDINATDWREVLNHLASDLKLTIEESDGKLLLSSSR